VPIHIQVFEVLPVDVSWLSRTRAARWPRSRFTGFHSPRGGGESRGAAPNEGECRRCPEHFPHAATWVRGIGRTKNEAFEEAAKALVSLTTDIEQVSPREKVDVSLSAPDDEQLLVEWLDSLVFEMATALRVLPFRVGSGGKLEGAWGEPGRASFDRPR
jgi:hypothetical protein